jgi:hypothetical protein
MATGSRRCFLPINPGATPASEEFDMEDHSFDTLNKALVHKNPRRSLLGAAALLTSLDLAAPLNALAKKGNGKGKGKEHGKHKDKQKNKNKGKGQGQPQLCGPDIHEACASEFSLAYHTPKDVQSCTDQCEQCRAAGTAFCIIEREERATCCPGAEACCGDGIFGDCCAADRCCARAGGDPPFCAQPGKYCCRDGTGGSCRLGEACCADGTCLACEAPAVPNPATCECACPDGTAPPCGCDESCLGPVFGCCDGECVDLTSNNDHCGGCDRPPCTEPGKQCCNGGCVDVQFNNAHCGDNCQPCPSGRICCNGACVDPFTDPNHCGRCGISAPGHFCCGGFLWLERDFHCCFYPSGRTWPCHNGGLFTNQCCVLPGGGETCCPRPP